MTLSRWGLDVAGGTKEASLPGLGLQLSSMQPIRVASLGSLTARWSGVVGLSTWWPASLQIKGRNCRIFKG